MNPETETADTDEDFDSGFEEKGTPTPDAGVTPPGTAEVVTPVATATDVVEPKLAQITVDELTALKAAAEKTTVLEGQVLKAFGTIGTLNEIVTKLKSSTPAGATVELPADLFAELEASNPDLAPRIKTILEKALKGAHGTGQQAGASAEELKKLLTESAAKREQEALDESHPTWREIVGAVDGHEKHNPNNEFRKWLVTQPAEYQHKINTTNSSFVLSRAIDKFIAAKAAPPVPPTPTPKTAIRKDRIADAVTAKGDRGQPAPAKTVDDEFNEGFSTG